MEQIIWMAPAAVVLWNCMVFALYGIDKYKAQKGKWRTSEFALIAVAFLMGSAGALLGMKVFRHKTKHLKFRILVPLALLTHIGLFVLYFICDL